jgi:hypothetical protein
MQGQSRCLLARMGDVFLSAAKKLGFKQDLRAGKLVNGFTTFSSSFLHKLTTQIPKSHTHHGFSNGYLDCIWRHRACGYDHLLLTLFLANLT